MDAQEGFFHEGMQWMKPLTMADVAQTIGVHETTVSRGVSGKYLRCKHGLLPLRRFFSTGKCPLDTRGRRPSLPAPPGRLLRRLQR